MDFKRRLTLFSIGIGLGCLVAWGIYGQRLTNWDWLPNERVKLRLASTLIRATPAAEQMLAPLDLDLADLRAGMDSCDVSFSKSERNEDSLYYALSGTVKGKKIQFKVAALRDFRADSTATLLEVGLERK